MADDVKPQDKLNAEKELNKILEERLEIQRDIVEKKQRIEQLSRLNYTHSEKEAAKRRELSQELNLSKHPEI